MEQILVPHPTEADAFFTDQEIIACAGGGGALGHPKVFLEMEHNKQVVCPYCSRKFIFKH